jgi:sugar-specific transcriptional regulator TrmB
MTIPQSEEEVLTNLGLTSSQAKVYLTLVHNGPSKVMLISKNSGIHRAHLYEILRTMEETGFVEKKLETGMYLATPLKEVAPILIRKKQQEIAKLETDVNKIVEYIPAKTATTENKPEISLTLNRKRTLNMVQRYIENAKCEIELVQTWKRFIQFWEYYEKSLEKATQKGVKIKEVVEFPKDHGKEREFLKRRVFKNRLIELKFVDKTGGNFAIVDNSMLLLSTSQESANLGETPFLLSNYEGLMGLLKDYFELSWQPSETSNSPNTMPQINIEAQKKIENHQ